MRRSLLKLMFAVVLFLLIAPFKGSSLLASDNNWCWCSGSTYLYYDDGGPSVGHEWHYLDERSPLIISEPLTNPGGDGGGLCLQSCVNLALYWAGDLCSSYSGATYPSRHYQIQVHYIYQDFDNTSGGNGEDWFDTGASFEYCS